MCVICDIYNYTYTIIYNYTYTIIHTHIYIIKHYGKHYGITYPLVNIQKAIENGHRNSGFSHEKWRLSSSLC